MQELVSIRKKLCIARIIGTETTDALDGAKVQEVVSSIYASPRAVVERAKGIGEGLGGA